MTATKIFAYSLVLVCSFIFSISYGQATNGASANQAAPFTGASSTQIINQPNGTQLTVQTYYCPSPSDLVKNGLFWGTIIGGWKSYSESFDQKIVSFLGAQWNGINVGKMICLYQGNAPLSFPITVQNDALAQAPSAGLWGRNLGGYQNCHSNNPLDCPFVVKTQSVNMQQIYNSIDFYKGKPSILNNNNQ